MNQPESGIKHAELDPGPLPWAASVTVYWQIEAREWGRRRRWRRLRKVLGDLEVNSGYIHREDMVMDSTIIYFKHKDDAVNAYFYFS